MDGVSMIELYLANRDIRQNYPTFEELGKLKSFSFPLLGKMLLPPTASI
jgi:hypothetical protein